MKKIRLLEVTRSYHPFYGGLEKFVSERLKLFNDLRVSTKVITNNISSNIYGVENYENVEIFKGYTRYNVTPNLLNYNFNSYDIISVNQIGYFLSDYTIFNSKNIILTPHLYFHTRKYSLIKDLHRKYLLPSILKKN